MEDSKVSEVGDARPSTGPVEPSAPIVATVRVAPVPVRLPPELVAWVVPFETSGRNDWRLTDDVVAFAPRGTVVRYAAWRSTWERSWTLDRASSIARLAALGDLRELGVPASSEGTVVVRSVDCDGLVERLLLVRDAVAAEERSGLGIFDATPRRPRIGLASAWSPRAGPELLARDDDTEVWMRPHGGLAVVTAGMPPVEWIDEARLVGDTYELRSMLGSVLVPASAARPLAWIVPGSSLWRVRRIPEVVVWARTFAGVQDAADAARRHAAPMVLARAADVAPT